MKYFNEHDYQYFRDAALLIARYQFLVWFWQYHFGPWLWSFLKILAGQDTGAL